MNELAVPRIDDDLSNPQGDHYWSSANLEVWAVIEPTQEKKVLAEFSGASVERIIAPLGFPYTVYVFKLRPTNGRFR